MEGMLLAKFENFRYTNKRFKQLYDKKQLILAPKFQRRQVWGPKVKSYFLDSIIRGFSTPKIYLRETVDNKSRILIREVVDGQQRLRAILDFIDGKLVILPRDNEFYGGTNFKSLPSNVQNDFLYYETSVDLMRARARFSMVGLRTIASGDFKQNSFQENSWPYQ